MKLFIKNISSKQNLNVLKGLLDELGIHYDPEIDLGEVKLNAIVPQEKLTQFKTNLEKEGMTIIYDRKMILAEQVKYVVYEMLGLDERPDQNYSHYISKRLFLNYTYLANIFSETQHITIEHFIINLKIEKVKRLLLYSDYNISQIADLMQYSSIGHLSNQFKKVTGTTPSEFKKMVQKDAVERE